MQRKKFLKWSSLFGLASVLPRVSMSAATVEHRHSLSGQNDRAYWVALLDKMATPLLSNMSWAELRKNMPVVYSTTWDGRNKQVAYMEAFGRLIGGIAPFLALPADNSTEGKVRARLHKQTLQSLAHAVDPQSPDYLFWGDGKTPQVLVDAAHIAQAFLYAPDTLWKPLSAKTKEQFIHEFVTIRRIKPFDNNWVLFAAIIESFLLSVGEKIDETRIDTAIDKINK